MIKGVGRTLESTSGPDCLPDYERDRDNLTQEERDHKDQDLFGPPVHRIYAELHSCCGENISYA